MLKVCGICQRYKRYYTKLLTVKGRKYWVDACVECHTSMSMESKDNENEA